MLLADVRVEVGGEMVLCHCRPALFVDGQHHAREATSTQVVPYCAWYLASKYDNDPLVTRLLDTRAVYLIPSVNPDGNDIFLDWDQRQRKTVNPAVSDDDGDGAFDEDGREGAGTLTMTVANDGLLPLGVYHLGPARDDPASRHVRQFTAAQAIQEYD